MEEAEEGKEKKLKQVKEEKKTNTMRSSFPEITVDHLDIRVSRLSSLHVQISPPPNILFYNIFFYIKIYIGGT